MTTRLLRSAPRRLTLIVVFVLSTATTASSQESIADRIDAFVRDEMGRQQVPGVAIGVVKRGSAIKVQGYGFANLEHQAAVAPTTIFQSGSLGKQFTAVAVMLLVEDGKLSLSDPVTKFFPDAPERGVALDTQTRTEVPALS